MSTNKPFCGVGKTPKGRKSGTMAECAELKQVRKFGEKKIDPRTLEAAQKKGKIKETREQLIIQIAGAKGAINRFKGRKEELEKKMARKELTADEKKSLKEYASELKKNESLLERATNKLKKVLRANEAAKAKEMKAKKPAAKKPVAKKPAVKKVPAKKPAVKKPMAKKPGTKRKVKK